jgi:hypothetical protein
LADQSTFSNAYRFHLCRAVNILVLFFVLVSAIGCSSARPSIKSLWQQVPPVRWSNKDSQSSAATKDKVAEPAVAANVAIKSDNTVQADTAEDWATPDKKTRSPSSRLASRFLRPENRPNDAMSAFETADIPEPNSNPFDNEAERPDSPLERLNAALSDDALQAQSLPQRSVTMLEERYRVDSLLSRANRLIEMGQLQQARESALLAQQVGDAAQLDYSPDDDRPIDLIRRIDGQLEEIRLAGEPGPEDRDEAEPAIAATEVPSPADTSVPSNSPEKELKFLTPKNHNWSAFFRREKKSPAISAGVGVRTPEAIRATETVTLGRPARVRDDFPSSNRSSRTAPHDAVVMANRSVSLGSVEPVSDTSASVPAESDERNTSVDDMMRPSDSHLTSLEVSRLRSDRAVSFAVSSDSNRSKFEPDESTGVLPEIDTVDTEMPRHIDESANDDESHPPERSDLIEPIRPADGWFVYLAIGICTVLALICYRRGAT